MNHIASEYIFAKNVLKGLISTHQSRIGNLLQCCAYVTMDILLYNLAGPNIVGIIIGTFLTSKVENLKLHIFQIIGAHGVPQWKISLNGGVAQHNSP